MLKNLGLLLSVLGKRRQLRKHDRWSLEDLSKYQEKELKSLRDFAYRNSSFYQKLHGGLEGQPLTKLPITTKKMLMENFDQVVTDSRMKLGDLESHLKNLTYDELFLDEYRVCTTAGTTGRRGIFPFNKSEWGTVMASYSRTYEWAGVRPGLLHWTDVAIVSSKNPLHQSARVGASAGGPWIRVLRIDSLQPIGEIANELNKFQPTNLIAYASMLEVLAKEAQAGRLHISPKVIISASEVLSPEVRILAKKIWSVDVYDVYGATETAGIASPCPEGNKSHFYDDLVLVEVVDEQNNPVPPDVVGSKILVTVLFSRTLPLIRYEMSDRVTRSTETCICGRPYGVMKSIEGRSEDLLKMPGIGKLEVEIRPNLFHSIFEKLPLGGWQVIQNGRSTLKILIVQTEREIVDVSGISQQVGDALIQKGVAAPLVIVEVVASIPKTAMGKTRLIVKELSE